MSATIVADRLKVLLLTPPMTQLNTPYPATAYLLGFLRRHAQDLCEATQADPAIELVLRLLSPHGLRNIRDQILSSKSNSKKAGVAKKHSKSVANFLENFAQYERAIDAVVSFLQGKDNALGFRIVVPGFLPEGPRFKAIDEYESSVPEGLYFAFGSLGVNDRAKYLSSLFIDDIADVIRDAIDTKFALSRYGEKLAASVASFTPMVDALSSQQPTLVELLIDEITAELLNKHKPDVICLTAPFPGNLLGGLRIAKFCKEHAPGCRIILGGGYVNTELRSLSEPRLFDYVDYVTLDDGEAPLLALLKQIRNPVPMPKLFRTFSRIDGKVHLHQDPNLHDIPLSDCGTPTYEGLQLDRYLSLFEFLNPMHRLWSDGRWNKLTLAHGCYWKGCSFCDTSLDYIARFEEQQAETILGRMESLIAETGQRGFHFVDEAAPPKTLFALSRKIIAKGLTSSWWGNIRFEKTFTPELTQLMAEAGCVAVSGGLEVASDRLLKLMNKGVTVEQVARVTHSFSSAGILVHAYLMYGFPTQTEQEAIDSLERVRQLFLNGCIHSAYWHCFAATVHSPIGLNPKKYGITLVPLNKDAFARNDIEFIDPTGTDHERLAVGLNKALYNYMHGIGLQDDVRVWFDHPVPKTKVPKHLIAKALKE